MAPTKKSSLPSKNRSSSSTSASKPVSLARVKGENFYRTAKQVARLKLLNSGKAVRDKDGKIIQAAAFQKGEDETKPGRVQPDRRWFGMIMFNYFPSFKLRFSEIIKAIRE
jgi:nuclear GTP-binding protein